MFGIFDASVRLDVVNGIVDNARVHPGCWNPGMYSEVPEGAWQAFCDAERGATVIAPLMVGRPIRFGGSMPRDGVYQFSVEDCVRHLEG